MWSLRRRRGFIKTGDFFGVILLVLVGYLYGGVEGGGDKVEYVRLPLLTFENESGDVQRSTQRPVKSSLSSVSFLEGGGDVKGVGERRSVGDGGGDVKGGDMTLQRTVVNSTSFNIAELLKNLTGTSEEDEEDDVVGEEDEEEEDEGDEETESGKEGNLVINSNGDIETTTRSAPSKNQGDKGAGEVGEEEDDDEEKFSELDLIELVQELEHQADVEEQTGIFPEILDILHGKREQKNISTSSPSPVSSTTFSSTRDNTTLRISLDENGDLQLGSEDLSQFSEEIVDGISEGVEESLRMSDDLILDDDLPSRMGDNMTAENRQFSVYLFQGQYYAEPRLNRFIDGALRNMGTELRVASMDPLFFRVLPRGHVAERERPIGASAGTGVIRRRRPVAGGGGGIRGGLGRFVRTKRQLPAFFRLSPKNKSNQKKNQFFRIPGFMNAAGGGKARRVPVRRKNRVKKKRIPAGVQKVTSVGGNNIFLNRRRKNQKLQQERRRRQKLRQQRLKQQLKNRLKKQQEKNRKKNQNKNGNRNAQNQVLLNRIRRRIRSDVGGGRIEGLSRVSRDGDAEMQLFGNYTLIRSHMKMGPIEITMQFRTKNGIRRSGATLPVIRAHTVTRVNHEGSEMIDYLLDRPHPESINVRGSLFPLAQKVARNIFARLFLPNSFLVSRLREKASLAFLSRPVVAK